MQDRNDLGLQLIERNEEVSVFYEKVNTQGAVIKQASLQLELREEEVQMLKIEVSCLLDHCCQDLNNMLRCVCFIKKEYPTQSHGFESTYNY